MILYRYADGANWGRITLTVNTVGLIVNVVKIRAKITAQGRETVSISECIDHV